MKTIASVSFSNRIHFIGIKVIITMTFSIFQIGNLFSKSIINGKILGGLPEVIYYQPFKNFGNLIIPSSCTPKKNGEFLIELDISHPSATKFIIGSKTIWLFLQPNDTLFIDINVVNNSTTNVPWLKVRGNNAEGHLYYNLFYNFYPIVKYYGIRQVFDKNKEKSNQELIIGFENELIKQTKWVDSLANEKSITQVYAEFMKVAIKSLIASEACILCDQYFNNTTYILSVNKKLSLKRSIFSLVNPLDVKLQTCTMSQPYYTEYFRGLYQENSTVLDSSFVLMSDATYLALAPNEIRENMLGKSIIVHKMIEPEKYNYCNVFHKYSSIYGNNPYTEYLRSINICSKIDTLSVKTINIKKVDFLTLISSLPYKRLYIDIWATWCLPCKLEFGSYQKKLKGFFKKNKIETVFISIDSNDKAEKWKSEINELHLGGIHILADETLKKSIQEIIFNGKSLSIPRYIVVNEKGKILDENAKRPSDGTLINELIKLFEINDN